MDLKTLFDDLKQQERAMLDRLRELVQLESKSGKKHKPALDALAKNLADRLGALGATVQSIENTKGGNHVTARWSAPGLTQDKKQVLILGHYDTVWPLGTIEKM